MSAELHAWPESRTTTVTWRAVKGPQMCAACGHNHYGWQRDDAPMAPTWRWCEDKGCDCSTLTGVAYAKRHGIAVHPATASEQGAPK